MITRDDIYDQNRGEREYYLTCWVGSKIKLPLTKDGFEALLERVTEYRDLPLDDASRAVIAGYVHHIANEQDFTTIKILGKILHKSVSNSTTWRIDQEIKEKRIKLAKEASDKAKAEQDNVVNMPPRPIPGDDVKN